MPQLNFTFVKMNHTVENFSAVDGIASDFQAAIELELKTARTDDGVLNASLFGPALTALNKTITDITERYLTVEFKNIPDNIVKLLQELINSNSNDFSILKFVYFSMEAEDTESSIEWTPNFTGTKQDDDEFDDEFDFFQPQEPVKAESADAEDGFIVIPDNVVSPAFASTSLIGNLLTTNKAVAVTPLSMTDSVDSLSSSMPMLARNLSTDSDADLSGSSSSSLLDSSNLAELQKQLSQSEIDLKSSNDDLSRSKTAYEKLQEATKPKIQNLLALKSLERFNNKKFNTSESAYITSSKVFVEKEPTIPVIRQEREAASFKSFLSLTTMFSDRYYMNENVVAQEKKHAAIKQKHEKLQQEYTARSCPPSFFAAQMSVATIAADLAQSAVSHKNTPTS
jgi:hypothetical protein